MDIQQMLNDADKQAVVQIHEILLEHLIVDVECLQQLVDTIKLIWQNYRECTVQQTTNSCRQHWMQLFLYYCQFINFEQQKQQLNQDLNQQDAVITDFNSFFKCIPEQVFAYLLECVCDIINQSECIELQANTAFNKSFIDDKFAQSNTPYDCNKIIALRTFLTHQLGQHLLLFLLRVDIKLIASQKSLSNLCLCLFPNSTWECERSSILQREIVEQNVFNFIGHFRLLQATNDNKAHYKYAYKTYNKNINNSSNYNNNINIELDLHKFLMQQRTSDEIAFLLLKLLHKTLNCCLPDELNALEAIGNGNNNNNNNNNNNGTIEQAAPNVSEILHFSLQKLCASASMNMPTIDGIASNAENALFLKWELLQLIVSCLNVQFAQDATKTAAITATNRAAAAKHDAEILSSTDFVLTNGSLYAAWTQHQLMDSITEADRELSFAYCYILCGMLHNTLILHAAYIFATPHMSVASGIKRNLVLNKNLYARELFGIVSTDGWLAMLKLLLLQTQQQQQQQQINDIISIIMRLLLKISDLFTKYDQQLLAYYNYNNQQQQQQHRAELNTQRSSSSGSGTLTNAELNNAVVAAVGARQQRKKLQQIQQIHCQKLTLNSFETQQQQQQQHYKLKSQQQQSSPKKSAQQQQQQTQQQQLWSCYFQRVMFDLLPVLHDKKLLEFILQGLMRNGICCCNFTLHNFAQLLKLAAGDVSLCLKKHVYKLLQRKLLAIIFMRQQVTRFRSNKTAQQQQPNFVDCLLCDASAKSLEFHAGILQNYNRHAAIELNLNDMTNATPTIADSLLFLRHLRHIGHFLPYDIAAGIIAEIVLPLFRLQKQLSLNSAHVLRVLQECLEVFGSYLHDVRLIKSFYMEENIKHLEDLLLTPMLLRSALELIKIGIESSTFLGDVDSSAREQLLLSRRLISLQLKSSREAGRRFQRLLQRVWAVHKFVLAQNTRLRYFWFNENSGDNDADMLELNLSALQVLQTVSLQWALNSELLKTSAQFYSEFARNYSIVLDEQEEQQLNGDNVLGEETALPSRQTILDILQLNYNALSSFLLILPRKRLNIINEQQQQEQIIEQNEHICDISVEQEKDIDCFCIALQNLHVMRSVKSIECNDLYDYEQEYADNNSFLQQLQTDKRNCCMNVEAQQNLSEIVQQNVAEHEQQQLQQEQEVEQEEEQLVQIFNIKQQIVLTTIVEFCQTISLTAALAAATATAAAATAATTTTTAHILYNSTGKELTNLLTSGEQQDEQQQATTPITEAYNNQSLLSKIFSLFGSFFGNARGVPHDDYQYLDDQHNMEDLLCIDADLIDFYDTNSEYKKLLLKLFEITLTICVKAYHNEDADKMQRHLRKLKTIILESATNNWQSHSEEHARDNVILKTLQILLKIAEMMGELQRNDETTTATSRIQNSNIIARNIADAGITPENRTPTSLSASLYGVTAAMEDDSDADLSDAGMQHMLHKAEYANNSLLQQQQQQQLQQQQLDTGESTADEGYEADAEIADSSAGNESDAVGICLESTYDARTLVTAAVNSNNNNNNNNNHANNTSDYWHAFQPASRYRSHVLHSGLCRLVVEILMELSHLCAQQAGSGAGGWCESLAQLANRLFVVRECLGGPLFLLRGFAPLLCCNDIRLKELQQCTLELITDLNTPDLLCAYFAIMATPNPPMEILVKYMGYICMGSIMRRPCPNVELEFPIVLDGKCISTAEPNVTQRIERMRNYHLQSQLITPFTRAPCIMPITHVRLWTEQGLTLSLWLQAKSTHALPKMTASMHDDDSRSINDDVARTHLLSIGTDQVMLSVYLNSNFSLCFETSRPNAEIKTQKSTDAAATNKTTTTTTTTTTASQINTVIDATSDATATNTNLNGVNKLIINTNQMPNETTINDKDASVKSKSQFRNALKQTKMVLLSHLSQMNFFHSDASGEACFENTLIELKALRLMRQKWTHLVIAIKPMSQQLLINIAVNALDRHEICLPFHNLLHLMPNHNFQLLALGEGQTARNDSRSTLDALSSLRYSLSNVMLFQSVIMEPQALINLTAMGPDFTELTQCQVGNWKANYAYLQLSRMQNANFGNHAEAMKHWLDKRLLVYSAQTPDIMTGYEWSICHNSEFMNSGRTFGLILYAELMQNQLASLQTAAVLCGGLCSLLFMFARVVETTSEAGAQANALDMLLKAALTDSQLYTEFVRQDYMSLIGHVIRTELCCKDVRLLRSIVNNACNQPLITRDCVNDNTSACIAHANLLVSVLQRYADWHRSGAEQSHVLDMLFQCVLALTREKHPQRDFNMEQLQRAGLMHALLNLCKIYVIESPNPVFISTIAAQRFVSIVSVFAGSPPSASLMDELMKLLLLLQRPSECYITHDRSKFYFLLRTRATPANTPSSLPNSARSYVNVTVQSPGKAVAVMLSTHSDRQLRKLFKNTQGTNYRQPLQQFVDNLEQTANCTRLNQQAPRLLSPQLVTKWRVKFKQQQLQAKGACSSSGSSSNLTPLKRKCSMGTTILHKRVRLHTVSQLSRDLRRADCERSKLQGNQMEQMLQGISESSRDTAEKCAETNLTRINSKLPLLTKRDFHNAAGIVALQEGLFRLLKDFLCLLPDNAVDEVLKHYIKLEYLLVVANHSNSAVRAGIVQLLAALTKRLSTQDLTNYVKHFYPHHLANQLCMHPTDQALFEACLQWVTGIYGNLEVILNTESLRLQHRFGLNALLAVLTNTQANQSAFLANAFHILRRLFNNADNEEQQQLIEAGLLQCSIKTLYNLYAKLHLTNHEQTEAAIMQLLMCVGEYALKSVGHITIIWDILNILSWYQDQQTGSIMQDMRAMQSQLQLHWIKLFYSNNQNSSNAIDMSAKYRVQTLKNSTLSISETRTRLELLIDRSAQFFTVCEASYMPTQSELQLFKWLVHYGISSNQRCNILLAWGLKPSRPRELRAFIVNTLWQTTQEHTLANICCDGKMLKSLLWLCQLEDLEEPLEHLQELCNHLGISDNDSAWNLANELERIEIQRLAVFGKQKAGQERTLHKFNALAANCIESSMIMTRRVADVQNAERKALMGHMKDYDESHIYTKWLEIIRRMTHEGAPWYCKERSEDSWELDNTEGPSRVHTRLRRCHLDIDARFIMEDYSNATKAHKQHMKQNKLTNNNKTVISAAAAAVEYSRPLEYLISSYDQQLNISLNSQILYNFPAKYLPVDGEIDGEIIVTNHQVYFLATYHCKYFYVSCDIANIAEIWLKRYQHQEKAFEIFLDTNQSLFFSLQNEEDWKIVRDVFCDKIVTPPDASKILLITQQWREGLLTNWEYLMSLNQISGRTYNDLMQYPVFPWILSNYTSEILNLLDANNYRKLERPIAVQHEDNEHHYVNNYTYINNTITNMGSITLKPYHYSSHYSNSGTVLHFMVRVPPFTSYFLRYQDNNFDLPDRTFHNLNTTWNLASRDSPTDVKELIPEFFSLPEMFENFERFNFGCRQNGERVEDVLMPPWCLRQARLFVLIHRQALESEFVRNNLHHWIDLIFGYKQTGEAAIEAINVFHPATYAMFVESEILDPIERKAVETMVRTYGQMPRQLFKIQHPSTKPLFYRTCNKEVLHTVQGLRWGIYVGSPQLPTPTLGNIHKLPGAEQLISFYNTNAIYGLPAKSCVMQGAELDTYNVISWGYEDRIVRIQPLSKQYVKRKNLLHNNCFDDITACGACPQSNQLWFGHQSGRISVYKCQSNESSRSSNKPRPNYVRGLRLSYNSAFRKIMTKSSGSHADAELESNNAAANEHAANNDGMQREGADLHWSGPTVLIRHTDQITCISLCVEFKIAVSAGRDGIAVIWDLNNLSYVRTIERPAEIHLSAISLLSISPTLGDIVTVHTIPWHSNSNADNEEQTTTDASVNTAAAAAADECFEVTEENTDDFVNVYINPNGKSMLRLHTINARYVQHVVHEERILAACYTCIKEGVGVNVIATAIEGGIVRLWSSWNLSFVSEIVTGLTNIKNIVYSTHQHLVVLTKESHIQVWETEGLTGNSPKFPQIVYK